MAIVKKDFKSLDIKFNTTNTLLKLDKFTLKMFNQLSYNQKIIELLIANFLFSFSDHYFSIIVIKTIKITLLKTKFELILSSQYFYQLDYIVFIDDKKIRLNLIYKYYIYCDFTF